MFHKSIFENLGDKAFGDVKISELPGWLARRSKTPVGMGRAMSRAYWRWSHKYVLPKVGLNIHKAWIIQLKSSFYFFAIPYCIELYFLLL